MKLWLSLRNRVDPHAGKLLLVGLAAVAWHNWRLWKRDQALLARQLEPESLPPPDRGTELPHVSVLVAAWNEGDMIERHIESFSSLRYPHRELVLCAGGEDGTYDLAAACTSERVIVTRQEAGEGKQRALSRCLERATGEIVFLTDADCLLNDESFERTLAPLLHEGEVVATGRCRPLPEQMNQPLVLVRWFTELYLNSRRPQYTDGILGRNAALRTDTLSAIGGFEERVRTGTDYVLAKQLLGRGYAIRYVGSSSVETKYADTLRKYYTQQTRWLRNVVMHGIRFGAYEEVVRCLIPSFAGFGMWATLLLMPWLGAAAIVSWIIVFWHVWLGRLRAVSFCQVITGRSLPLVGHVAFPAIILLDFAIWALAFFQYPFQSLRDRW